ncbi:MAG: YceI family protein [Candidatus Eremiobacteraeota bacterium]|nr:YceI family protein [Candidatus Eremiobacteraeota bacterium]
MSPLRALPLAITAVALGTAVAVLPATGARAAAAVSARTEITRSADLASSSVSLTVSQLFFSRVHGTIAITSASIVTPAATEVPRKVDVALDAASTTSGDPQRDADLRSGKFFDAARYPTVTFTSDRIVGTDPARFTIAGNLTIKGISRPISFETRVTGTSTGSDGKQHVRYVAVGSFRRSAYGITYARGIVGDNVTLHVVIDAV